MHWEYENGVHELAGTDNNGTSGPRDTLACHNRLVGFNGMIEVGPETNGSEDIPTLRIRRDGSGWEPVETSDDIHDWAFIDRAIAENVRCLEAGEDPELSAENALNATELIFAAWESSRRHGHVDLPLDVDDNPLVEMVEFAALSPNPSEDE